MNNNNSNNNDTDKSHEKHFIAKHKIEVDSYFLIFSKTPDIMKDSRRIWDFSTFLSSYRSCDRSETTNANLGPGFSGTIPGQELVRQVSRFPLRQATVPTTFETLGNTVATERPIRPKTVLIVPSSKMETVAPFSVLLQ